MGKIRAEFDFLSEYDELLNLANDPNIELTSIDFVNDDLTCVTYKKKVTQKVLEKVLERKLRDKVNIDGMQFGFSLIILLPY